MNPCHRAKTNAKTIRVLLRQDYGEQLIPFNKAETNAIKGPVLYHKTIFKLVRPSQKRYRNLVTTGNSLLTGRSKDQVILSSVIVMKLPIVS